MRVLKCDDVFARKLIVADQVAPVLRLDIETLDGVPCEDIPRCPQRDNVGVIREDLEGDRVAILAVVILVDVELEKFRVG